MTKTRKHEEPETDMIMAHAARMLAFGASDSAVREIVRSETGDDELAFLVFTAARLLAATQIEENDDGI